jgi:hypothetical protein
MPKQLYKVFQFHGGLNSNSDARDIAENELSEATDVMVDELGKIRLMGGIAAHKADVNAVSGWTGTLISGYGLFYFSHDRTGAEDSGSSEAITGDNYLALYDGNDGQVWIYSEVVDDAGGTGWDDKLTTGGGVIDIGSSNTSTAQVNYYSVDGAIRVCDGLHTNSNTPQWYGYVQRDHFSNKSSGTTNSYSKWIASDQQMPAPTKGLFGEFNVGPSLQDQEISGVSTNTGGDDPSATLLQDTNAWTDFTDADDFVDNDYIALNVSTGNSATIVSRDSASQMTTTSITGNWNSGNSYYICAPAGLGVNLRFGQYSGGSWGTGAEYQIAASFMYDGNQETDLYIYRHTMTLATNYYPYIRAMFADAFDPRYSGVNIYFRAVATYGVGDVAPWILLFEIDLTSGARINEEQEYNLWTGATYGSVVFHEVVSSFIKDPPTAITYEINSGVRIKDRVTSPKFKTAVVANRRAYIGNVQYTDSNSVTHTKGDAVIKSPVNQFDIFATSGLLEASVNDGDSIVKLEEYADRLLIFKKNKLELLNISQEIEFLEDTFMHKGVSHPAATCKTDFGIAWVNEQGCYLYDGQKVNNLLEKQGRQIIKESEWSDFVDEPMIGYLPKKRQLIVADDITTTGDGAAYLYDIVTKSWVKGAAATITDQAKTNFITDWNGDLVYAHTAGTVVKWADSLADATTTTSSTVDIKTKDIDFGQPGQVKRIYKFYVTHRGSASNIQLSYATNGDQDTYTEAGSELPVTSAVTDWVTTAITPTIFSCYSVRLRLFSDGNTPANFEINDITIVYRLKGQR